jgi:colanic acid biosynthesis glycosyl transferase WcaI
MVNELAEDLSAKGHRVTVQTGWPNHPHGKLHPGYRMQWRKMERDGQHDVQRVAMMIADKTSLLCRLGVYASFAASSLLNGLTLGRHDVVVCLSTPLIGVWTAWALARLWRARFVNVIFDLWPEVVLNAGLVKNNLPYRVIRKIDTLNCRCSDAISVLGQGMKDEVVARGVSPEAVKVIPFWIDTQKIKPISRNNAWRQEHDISSDTFVALFAGTIGYASGAQILAETARQMEHRKDILILVVGEGVVKKELEALVKNAGITNLRFLPFQPAERLKEVQGTANVGLVTLLPNSGITSVPSKVLGYMAAGRPVIASVTKQSDTAQLVRNASCGLVCAPQNAQALANSIVRLADDDLMCRNFGVNARNYVEKYLSRVNVVNQYEQLIGGQ